MNKRQVINAGSGKKIKSEKIISRGASITNSASITNDASITKTVIVNTADKFNTINVPRLQAEEQFASDASDLRERVITGRVLMTHDESEKPVTGARVELYRVSPMKAVANNLTSEIIAHCRALLREKLQPIELYARTGYIDDVPLMRFADVLRLREIPGYELLAAAAKSQNDASFTQLLCNNPAILKPLLCYYHPTSFPAVCTGHTATDAAGLFHFTVAEQSNKDERSGYYFIVRRLICNNLYITLYNPMPAAWHTYWDCADDEAIVLRTWHPLAVGEQ